MDKKKIISINCLSQYKRRARKKFPQMPMIMSDKSILIPIYSRKK